MPTDEKRTDAPVNIVEQIWKCCDGLVLTGPSEQYATAWKLRAEQIIAAHDAGVEARAKEEARKEWVLTERDWKIEARGFERGLGNVCTAAGIGFPDGVHLGAQGKWIVERVEARARLEERATCCKAVCYWCREGNPVVECNEVITANGRSYWHKLEGGTFDICHAQDIRKLESAARESGGQTLSDKVDNTVVYALRNSGQLRRVPDHSAALRSVLRQLESAQQDIHRICGMYRTIGDECADALAPIIEELKQAVGKG